jgi:hypothetical protein
MARYYTGIGCETCLNPRSKNFTVVRMKNFRKPGSLIDRHVCNECGVVTTHEADPRVVPGDQMLPERDRRDLLTRFKFSGTDE